MKAKLDKSPECLAREIVEQTRMVAELHLIQYGASEAGAAAVVAMNVDAWSDRVVGRIADIARDIAKNC